jgi:hypothetical protein
MRRGLAIARHLIEMIGDAINFDSRLLDCLGRAICGLRSFVRGGLRLCRRLLGLLGGLLSLGGCGFGLLGLLIVVRRTSWDRNRENQKRQGGKNSAHQL